MNDGLLLINKPKGWTSHDVVARVRSILRQAQKTELLGLSLRDAAQGSNEERTSRISDTVDELRRPADVATRPQHASAPSSAGRQGDAMRKIRVGHAGTLDPMAEGLLLILVGKTTKDQAAFMRLPKTYEAEITLGASSTTDDGEGEISKMQNSKSKKPTRAQVEAVLKEFLGKQEQRPPVYSALKIKGQRAYKLARQGKEVVVKVRPVTIYELELKSYTFPKLQITATVSSGTYIRALARDIGQKLTTGAYLSGLTRTSIGPYSIKDSIQIEKLKTFEHILSTLTIHPR